VTPLLLQLLASASRECPIIAMERPMGRTALCNVPTAITSLGLLPSTLAQTRSCQPQVVLIFQPVRPTRACMECRQVLELLLIALVQLPTASLTRLVSKATMARVRCTHVATWESSVVLSRLARHQSVHHSVWARNSPHQIVLARLR